MPTNRTPLHRHRRGLTLDQRMDLFTGGGSGFTSDDERREAWFRHREPLLALMRNGQRPDAWWCYESPITPRPPREYEMAALYEAGLLSAKDSAQHVKWWKDWFDKAQEPGFTYCIGHAKPGDTFTTWIEGDEAKQRHYVWAGIPRSLISR